MYLQFYMWTGMKVLNFEDSHIIIFLKIIILTLKGLSLFFKILLISNTGVSAAYI